MRSSGTLICLASASGFGAMGVLGKLAYGDGSTVGTLLATRFALAALLFWVLMLAGRGATSELRDLSRRDLLSRRSRWARSATRPRRAPTSPRWRGWRRGHCRCSSTPTRRSWRWPGSCSAASPLDARRSGRTRARFRRGLVLVLASAGTGQLDPLGVALGLAAAGVYSAYILVSGSIAGRMGPRVFSTLVCSGAAVTLTAGAGLLGELRPQDLTAAGWGWLTCLALVSTVAAVSLLFAGIARGRSDGGLDPVHGRAGGDGPAGVPRLRRGARRRAAAGRRAGALQRARALHAAARAGSAATRPASRRSGGGGRPPPPRAAPPGRPSPRRAGPRAQPAVHRAHALEDELGRRLGLLAGGLLDLLEADRLAVLDGDLRELEALPVAHALACRGSRPARSGAPDSSASRPMPRLRLAELAACASARPRRTSRPCRRARERCARS